MTIQQMVLKNPETIYFFCIEKAGNNERQISKGIFFFELKNNLVSSYAWFHFSLDR
jgi:hypothetical protein